METTAPIASSTDEQHEKHQSNVLKWALAGTALAAGAVILAPYVLPAVGIGTAAETVDAMTSLHTATGGTGLAGTLNNAMKAIPLVGEALAKGGLATAITSGALGVGGVLLNHFSSKGEDGQRKIRWGKVIGTAAMITSALIALPSVLTGISAGIVFLSSFAGEAVTKSAVNAMASTLGASNETSLAITGASAASITIPHLLTCGSVLPAIFTFGLEKDKPHHRAAAAQAQKAATTQSPAQPAAAPDAMHGHGPDEHHVVGKVLLEKPTTAGEMVNGRLVLTNAQTGELVTADQLKVVNEAKIHFFINNSSLTDYHHIHPTPSDKPGEYDFSFKANTSQPYKGWATITTQPDNKHTVVQVTMPPAVNRSVPPNVRMNSQTEAGGLTFDWKADGPMQKGKPTNVEVTIKDANGKPVTDLQPVYGEWSHLEGFHTDLNTMVHTHPTGREPQGPDDRMCSPLHFTITPEKDGPVQFYVQVKRGDQDIYAPIGQMVKVPEKITERLTQRSNGPVQIMRDSGYGLA